VALRVRGFVRAGAAIAACTLIAACTPEPPAENPPTPSARTPTASPTPTESEIERQMRLDYEAAEAAYRRGLAESDRIARRGGSKVATKELKAVSTGKYLKLQVQGLKSLKDRGERLEGGITIVGVRPDGGYQPSRLRIVACEDNSTWKLIAKDGKDVTPKNQPDYIQSLTVIKVAGSWKVSDGSSEQVQTLAENACKA